MTVDFLIIGGGCFGSFYMRQLLRGRDKISLGKIHLVDHDADCQAIRALKEAPSDWAEFVSFHIKDWKDFLLPYLNEQVARRENGKEIVDYYVPPTCAPHIFLDLFLEKAANDLPGILFERLPLEQPMGTPFDSLLPNGTRAMSFATWTCPSSCIEPPTCPHIRGPKSWDMKEHLTRHFDDVHLFQCRHYAMGVGAIPMKEIVDEYLNFRRFVSVPGTHHSALATVSSCHGLIGLVKSQLCPGT